MIAKGLYKTKTLETGAEYALVDYRVASSPGEITREQYVSQGYMPLFDDLPTKTEYEKNNANRT